MSRLTKKMLMLVSSGNRVPWYLRGGIPLANCIAAYRATGAASQAGSYTNLANPVTYDLTETHGANPVTWDAINGWKGAVNAYLATGINTAVAGTWSVLIKFTNAQNLTEFLFGSVESTKFWFINPRYASDTVVRYGLASTTVNRNTPVAAGVLGLCGLQPYRNGVADGAEIVSAPIQLTNVYITNSYGGLAQPFTGYVQAMAIYNVPLTAPQALAASTAMAAL